MEEHGRLVRGMFIHGFGAAQFAESDTVDALRHPSEHRSQSVVAVSVLDPANLSGSAIGWPDVPVSAGRPVRRAGAVVVLGPQGALLYAAAKAKHLTAFQRSADVGVVSAGSIETGAASNGLTEGGVSSTESAFEISPDFGMTNDEQLRKAATELAYALKRSGNGTVTFSDMNGEPLNARHPFARILHQAGFIPVPQGMRLY